MPPARPRNFGFRTCHGEAESEAGFRICWRGEVGGWCLCVVSPGLLRYHWREEQSTMNFDRITRDPNRLGGQPCIRDLRITLRRALQAIALYPDRDELRREYPELEDEDLRQALEFAAAQTAVIAPVLGPS